MPRGAPRGARGDPRRARLYRRCRRRRDRLVGYKARRHTGLIDVDRVDHYDPRDFWEPVFARGRGEGGSCSTPHDFYILASREAVVVPPDHAAEMLPYDTLVGEFRVHYAGFFDPGFGTAETGGAGSRAVLEVRSHEVPFLIEHGQIVGRLVYERLIARPDKLYGARDRLVLPEPGPGAVEALQGVHARLADAHAGAHNWRNRSRWRNSQ